MIEFIPFIMVAVAFWMHKDSPCNLGVIGAFIVIYTFSLFPHYLMDENAFIFIINVLSATALASLINIIYRKPSLLISIMLLSCFGLTILNSIAFIAYNYYNDPIYQAALLTTDAVIGMQWASLMVRDDGHIANRMGADIHMRLLDWTNSVLRRA